MAIRKKNTGKKISTVDAGAAKEISGKIETIFMKDRRITISVGLANDFGKAKVNIGLSENIKEDVDVFAKIDEMYDGLEGKLDELFDRLVGEEEEGEEEETEEETEEEGEEEELTEDDVKAMKRPELTELITDEELDIDPKKFKKINDLRTAVIEALFEEEEEEEGEEEEGEEEDDNSGEDWEDDEWEDED